MDKIVIYCKSYHKDVNRAKTLFDSIQKYNSDDIPFYISVPKSDINIFKDILGTTGYTLIEDEEIDKDNQGWLGQQIVKSQFWNLGLCENYVSIDSDNQFIRPFYISDFMYDDETPYTICHEYKSFFEFMDKNPLSFDPYESFYNDRKKIMELFGRKGIVYDFGPDPIIWSTKVWKSLFENYIKANNLTFADLIKFDPSEFTWYGEWLLHSKEIRLMPREEIFKNYHYKHQYEEDQKAGYTFEHLSRYYLGVCIQSNWNK
tara:strand:+ start:4074 stop:4853 length:780 start_codon:yes stop_codon:yes gene_type:complete